MTKSAILAMRMLGMGSAMGKVIKIDSKTSENVVDLVDRSKDKIELIDDSMVKRHISEKKSQLQVVALGPVPSQAFVKALRDENKRELDRAGYFINDDYKAPTMRSNIRKGKRK